MGLNPQSRDPLIGTTYVTHRKKKLILIYMVKALKLYYHGANMGRVLLTYVAVVCLSSR